MAAEAGNGNHAVGHHNLTMEKLDGSSNYHTWKFSMKNLLLLEGLWDLIEGEPNADPNGNRERKTLARICLSIKTSLYQYVWNATTAKEAWNKLSDVFQDKGLFRRVLLLRKLHKIHYNDYNCMTSYIEAIITTVQQLSDIGKTVDDEEVAEILLSGLPAEYDSVVSNLSTATVTTKISSELVRARLLQEFSRRSSLDDNGTAFTMKTKKSIVVCDYCKKSGHTKTKCFKLKRTKKQQQSNEKIYSASALISSQSSDFYIDSGATNHMVNDKALLQDFQDTKKAVITVANNQTINSEGMGSLTLHEVRLLNAMYVPELSVNLISV